MSRFQKIECPKKDRSGYNNPNYGKKHPKLNLGETNGMWKGDNVSYRALHDYIKYHLPKPLECEKCKQHKRLDLSNKTHEKIRDLSNWQWLCRSCHMKYDYVMELRTHW